MKNKKLEKILYIFRKSLYWLLPVVIIYLIFMRVDLTQLIIITSNADRAWIITGITLYLAGTGIGGVRWAVLLRQYYDRSPSWGFAIKHYWMGLSLGFLAPASISWEIYRIVLIGKKFGSYITSSFVILAERLIVLLASAFLVFLLSFFIPRKDDAVLETVLKIAYFIVAVFFVFLFVFVLIRRNRLVFIIYEKLEKSIVYISNLVFKKTDKNSASLTEQINFKTLIKNLFQIKAFCPVVLLSLLMHFIGGIRNYIFFISINCEVSLWVNLFLVPVFLFVFALPISFGSIGIREGAFILFYGLFGVSAENALIVSFLNLAGILSNILIGAALMLIKNFSRSRD